MKFCEIIQTNNWPTIELTFLNLYPNQKGGVENHLLVIEALKFLQPKESEIDILLNPYN